MKKNSYQLTPLHPREKECLWWVAQGKTAEEVAIILNLKILTVKYYLRETRKKLSCTTVAQAIYKAVTEQLL